MPQMLLADIGRLLPEDEQLDICLSRLGGEPVWLPLPSGRRCENPPCGGGICGCCGLPRTFVGQLDASYEGAPGGPCRLLHIFGCFAAGCGGQDRAWCILRSVGPAPIATAASSVVAHTPAASSATSTPSPLVAAVDDDIGLSGSGHAREDVSHWDMERWCGVRARNSACDGKAGDSQCQIWPCFSLVIYEEPEALSKIQPGHMSAHELELLERYRNSELALENGGAEVLDEVLAAAAGLAAGRGGSRSRSRGGRDHSTDRSGDETGADTGAEGDVDPEEEDCEDATGDGRWVSRFQRRLERSPTQVMRYSWGGRPLWIVEPPEEAGHPAWPPPCSRCGSKRTFEAQLLPTLLYQARQHYPELGDSSEIEWGSVLFYTCGRDCAVDEPCEEFVVVQPAV